VDIWSNWRSGDIGEGGGGSNDGKGEGDNDDKNVVGRTGEE